MGTTRKYSFNRYTFSIFFYIDFFYITDILNGELKNSAIRLLFEKDMSYLQLKTELKSDGASQQQLDEILEKRSNIDYNAIYKLFTFVNLQSLQL
jgi:hypothetical protein